MSSQEGDIINPTLEIGYQAPRTTGALTPLKVTAAELKESIMAKMETWTICDRLPILSEVPFVICEGSFTDDHYCDPH